MKFKNISGRIAIILSLLLLITTAFFSVTAVGEDGENDGNQVATDEVVTETEPPTTQEPVYTETEPKTEEQADTTEEIDTEPETEKQIENVETDPPTEEEKQDETTEEDYIFLPEAVTDEDPTAVVVKPEENGDLTYGYASWVCVIVGVLTIIIIIISNKSNYTGGAGKHRYGEGNKITGAKQRLLNDDYYTNRKYNSYYDKDIRR